MIHARRPLLAALLAAVLLMLVGLAVPRGRAAPASELDAARGAGSSAGSAAAPGPSSAVPFGTAPRPIAADSPALRRLPPLPRRATALRLAPRPGAGAPVPAAQGAPQRVPLDGFESPSWPDASRWPLVADLGAAAGQDGRYWGPDGCQASAGTRGLRATGGGEGAGAPCNAGYPAGAASSALLYLDLSAYAGAASLALSYDVWLEVAADEGLLINYLRFAPDGSTAERRRVTSASLADGRWSRDQRLDLAALRDPDDPAWRGDLRGERAYLELLFLSVRDGGARRGVWLDELALIHEPVPTPTPRPTDPPPTSTPPPSPTPVPPSPTPPGGGTAVPPGEATNACQQGDECWQLALRAFVDSGCDGRYQVGVDSLLLTNPRPRAGVRTEAVALGATLGRQASQTFLFPAAPWVDAILEVPAGYEMCGNAENPERLEAGDFQRGLARIDLRVQRVR